MTDSLKPPTLLYLLSTSLQSQKKLPAFKVNSCIPSGVIIMSSIFFYFTLVKIWIITEMHKITNFDYKKLISYS